MKGKLLILLLLAFTLSANVSAQTATEGASPLRDSVKQKVAEELAQIKKAVSKKAFLGTISSVSEATLTLTNLRNQTRNVVVGTDSVIKLKNGKDGTVADLKSGLVVLVMGDVDSAGVMTSKRLLVISQPAEFKRQAVMGTVTKASSSSLTLEKINTKDTWTIKLTSANKYTAKTKASDVKVGLKIVVLGTVTSDKALTALQIHLIPAATATPSSVPSPTP